MKFAIESYGGVRGVATIEVPCPLTTPDPNPNKHRSFVVPSLSVFRHHGILLNYVILNARNVVGNVSSGALVWRYTNKCTTNSVGNNYTSLVGQHKTEYYKSKIGSADQRQLFRLVDGMIKVKPVSPLPSHTSAHERTEKFSTYFIEKIVKLLPTSLPKSLMSPNPYLNCSLASRIGRDT